MRGSLMAFAFRVVEISPALGQMHFHSCLRALSLFEVGSARCADRTPQRGVPTSSEHEHE